MSQPSEQVTQPTPRLISSLTEIQLQNLREKLRLENILAPEDPNAR